MAWVATIIGAGIAGGVSLLVALLAAGPSDLRRAGQLADLANKFPEGGMRTVLQIRAFGLALEATSPTKAEVNSRFAAPMILTVAVTVGGAITFFLTLHPASHEQSMLRLIGGAYGGTGIVMAFATFYVRNLTLRRQSRHANRRASGSDPAKAGESELQSHLAGDTSAEGRQPTDPDDPPQ